VPGYRKNEGRFDSWATVPGANNCTGSDNERVLYFDVKVFLVFHHIDHLSRAKLNTKLASQNRTKNIKVIGAILIIKGSKRSSFGDARTSTNKTLIRLY